MRRFFLTLFDETSSQRGALLLAVAGSLFAAGAVAEELPSESSTSRSRYLMGTVCEVIVRDDPSRAEAAFDEIGRVERLISTWAERSELSALNRTGSATVSEELYALLAEAMLLARATGGAFNPLVGPLVDAWRTRSEGALPVADDLDRTLPLLALDGPRFHGSSRRIDLPRGAAFEEGGFGKGYALDRAAAALASQGVDEFLIDFGGQLMIRSPRPVEVAIAHPERRDEIALLLHVTQGSVSTSSGSEKSFVAGGERFSHILDPRTGRALPPRGSVSVIAPRGLDADVLSTALYVMGPEQGLAWADAHAVTAVFAVPSPEGWDVLLSKQATTSGLAVRSVRAEFKERKVSQ